MFIDFFMADGCDLVDKDHDISLENLSGVSKVPDVAKAE